MYFASIVVAGILPVMVFLPVLFFLEKRHGRIFPGGKRFTSGFYSVFIFVIFSVLSVIPSYLIQYLILLSGFRLGGFLGIVFDSFVSSALVEETVRLVFILLGTKIVLSRFRLKNYSLVLLSALSGLVFGSIENILYGVYSPQAIVLRIFTSVILHGVCGFLVGKYIILMLDNEKKEGVFFLVLAWAGHGIYNFFIQLPYFDGNFPPFVFSFGVLIFMLLFCFFLARDITD